VDPSDPEPEPDPLAPLPWHALDRSAKLRRAAAATFTVFAILGAFYRLAPMRVARHMPSPVQATMRGWARTLAGAGRWDMFVAPPRDRPIVVEGRAKKGTWVVLVDPFDTERSFFRRVVDARLRKFIQKFSQAGHRGRFAKPYLAYVCRAWSREEFPGLRFTRIVRRPHPFRDRGTTARPKTLIVHRCGDPVAPPAKAPRPRAGDRTTDEGL